jgi:uncharacterized membrane protein
MTKLNNWLALHMTLAAGTVWCFYTFFVLCLLPMMFPAYQGDILYVSNCFQLVLLPIIMVGQNLLGAKSEARAEQDHQMIMGEFAEIKEMHAELKTLVEGKV